MLIDLPMSPEDQSLQPGTWRAYVAHTPEPEFRPYWVAAVRCPTCSARMSLVNHTISPDGIVTPSIGHPIGISECGWHPPNAKLIGWAEAIAKPLPPIPPIETCARCGYHAHTISGWGTDGRYTGIICFKCVSERNDEMAKPT